MKEPSILFNKNHQREQKFTKNHEKMQMKQQYSVNIATVDMDDFYDS